jgi:CRISPR-associated protein Csb2
MDALARVGLGQAPRKARGWRWRIANGPPLAVRDTLRVGEALREMLMDAARWSRGSATLPLCLHGPTPDHSHARYLPADEDGNGVIDHLTVYASGGLDGVAIRLLAASERLFVPQLGAHDLEPVWMGDLLQVGSIVESTTWRSLTPYVAPWHKATFERQVRREEAGNASGSASITEKVIEKQIRRELISAGLAEDIAEAMQAKFRRRGGTEDFALTRSDDKPPPSPPIAAFVELSFPVPVGGLVALGYASHFGLGQFAASS